MASPFTIPDEFLLKTTGDGANLDTLPDELLLRIANHIHHEPSGHGRHHDLSAFSHVAYGCWDAVQEVLYRSPTVPKPAIRSSSSCEQNTQILLENNRLACLLRTLIEKPGLAEKVKHLQLCCLHPRWQYVLEKQTLPWTSRNRPVTKEERWVSHFLRNSPDDQVAATFHKASSRINQFAMIGFILRLCPNLEMLRLDVYRVLHHEHKLTGLPNGCWELEPQPFSTHDMFGALNLHPRGKAAPIRSLAKLASVTINGPLPPSLTYLPGLKHLQLSMFPGSRRNRGHTCLRSPLAGAGTPAVTRLVLNLDIEILKRFAAAYPPLHWQLVTQMRAMPHLKSLDIRLYQTSRSHNLFFGDSYDNIQNWLPSPTIENLVIDTADVYTEPGGWIGLELLWSLHSLANHLPNLRRLVVPQEILLRVHRMAVHYCELPGTLEAIEVIDCTRALNTWAEYIVRRRQQNRFPHLKCIVLWLCRRNTFLGPDWHLDHFIATNRRIYGILPGAWLLTGEAPWAQLDQLGVDVFRCRKRLGWRN